VQLFVRYTDGVNPPSNYSNVGPTFNSGTQKYEAVYDPGDAQPVGGRIDYFWQAADGSPQHNITATGVNSVNVVDCASIIP